MSADANVRNSVAVADPDSPTYVIKPNADGSISTQSGYPYQNITTSATTTVKSGAGTLNGITVNTKGSVASSVVIYDNTAGSGTKIGTIDSLNLSGQFLFNVAFGTGLTIVTTGAPDITVTYA